MYSSIPAKQLRITTAKTWWWWWWRRRRRRRWLLLLQKQTVPKYCKEKLWLPIAT